jgi:hypothetical protein
MGLVSVQSLTSKVSFRTFRKDVKGNPNPNSNPNQFLTLTLGIKRR